jgi:hypothetical protein
MKVRNQSGMELLTTLLGGTGERSPDETSVISNSPDMPGALIDAVIENSLLLCLTVSMARHMIEVAVPQNG